MWLKVEDGTLINLELVDKVIFHTHSQKATMWAGGIIIFPESNIAFRYFQQERLLAQLPNPYYEKLAEGPEPVQSGQGS